MILSEYILSLKAGDVVTVQRDGMPVEKTVDRVTKTQIIIGTDRFHRIGDEWRLGDAIGKRSLWGRHPHIMLPEKAEELIREEKRKQVMWRLRQTLSGPLTLATIPTMHAALDEAEAVLREGDA